MDKLAEAKKQIKFTQFNNIEDSYDMEDIWSLPKKSIWRIRTYIFINCKFIEYTSIILLRILWNLFSYTLFLIIIPQKS